MVSLVHYILISEVQYRLDGHCQQFSETDFSVIKQWNLYERSKQHYNCSILSYRVYHGLVQSKRDVSL